jgi:hypothetical protein
MDNPESVRHLLARLKKRGLIIESHGRNGRVLWVVRTDLQDPKRVRRTENIKGDCPF